MKVPLDGASPGRLTRFIAEGRTLAQLEHPNIVHVHEVGVNENGLPFYTMPLVRGTSLSKVLELLSDGDEATVKRRPLVRKLLTAFQKVCDAVAYAHHQGLIHRNLETANIILGDYGEVFVMGWGAAERMKEEGEKKRMKDEGGRMKENANGPARLRKALPSPVRLHPSSFILHPL